MAQPDALREQIAKLLDWEEAHVGFDKALAGLAAASRGVRPAGSTHSAWELVEHIRICQRDILSFCVDAEYQEHQWPGDYWPPTPAPPTALAWDASLEGYRRDREALQQLARNTTIDLLGKVPNGSGQTYLRELLLVADHTSYHVAQLVDLRRQLGAWE
jgi:uncharacterized damage-inducible protein DinB